MTLLAVSQRVLPAGVSLERRDALDQAWIPFLLAAGLTPVPVPNVVAGAQKLLADLQPHGILLTGGNDLSAYGGDAPDRDDTEALLIEWARQHHRPLLGVCRGMQMLAHHFGGTLTRVEGHVACRHEVEGLDRPLQVNSFHQWAVAAAPGFRITATAGEVAEAMVHEHGLMAGQMWHPERNDPMDDADLERFRRFFKEQS